MDVHACVCSGNHFIWLQEKGQFLITNVQYFIHHNDLAKALYGRQKHIMNNGDASGVSGILFEEHTHTLSSPVYVHYETASVNAGRYKQRR